jgi:hypothetical protein
MLAMLQISSWARPTAKSASICSSTRAAQNGAKKGPILLREQGFNHGDDTSMLYVLA